MATDNSFLTVVNGQTGSNVSFGGQNSAITATGSLSFDGTGFLTLPQAVGTSTASIGMFTIEAWVYLTGALVNGPYTFGGSWCNGDSTQCSWIYSVTAAGRPEFGWGISGTSYPGDNPKITGLSRTISINTWTHLAVVRDATNKITMYVGGTADSNTATISGQLNINTTSPPKIGNGDSTSHNSLQNPWVGYITNFRFVDGIALYSGTFTPSTAPLQQITNTELLLTAPQANTGPTHQEIFIQDSSFNNWLITNSTDTSIPRNYVTFSTSSPFTTTTNQVITNSIVDAVKYASNSIATIGGSAYWPTAYADTKTAQISLNDPMVRALAGVPTGQISFSNFVNDTIYTQTWRSRISHLASYSVPGVTQDMYGWAKDQATANAIIYSSINSLATVGEKGNTFGNTAVGLYEPNSPNGANSIPIVGIVSISTGTVGSSVYVYTTGNTASTNLHAIRIGANSVIVGNQTYANTTGGYQNFGNVTAGNVGGIYYTSGNAAGFTRYSWAGQVLGTNTFSQGSSYLSNVSSASPTNTGNVTTFYIT
jgi:hypothetical protein